MWLLLMQIACTSDKNTQNTQNTQQEDYIINPPDFEALERRKAKRGRKAKSSTGPQSKEDSLTTYIKKFTHLFYLRENQMKALEFILIKHEKKITKLKAARDLAGLKKAIVNNEKNLKQVLGDDLYNKKVNFDLSYNKVIRPKKPVQTITANEVPLSSDDRKYLLMVSTALNLDYELMIGLKEIIQKHNDAIQLAKPVQLAAFDKRRVWAEKKLLGDSLYLKKNEFDIIYTAGK